MTTFDFHIKSKQLPEHKSKHNFAPKVTQETFEEIRVIKLPNSEQSSKEKVKTHKYINRQNQSTTGKLGKP